MVNQEQFKEKLNELLEILDGLEESGYYSDEEKMRLRASTLRQELRREINAPTWKKLLDWVSSPIKKEEEVEND